MKKYRGFDYTLEFAEDLKNILNVDVITLIDDYIDNDVSILDVIVGGKVYNINIENNVINIILRQIKL